MRMWVVKCPRDGLKGQKQIAYGNAVGHGDIRSRPERAKAMTDATLLPFQGGGVRVLYPQGAALGYALSGLSGRMSGCCG